MRPLTSFQDKRALLPGLVKICGLREPAHAEAAALAGADLLGFIFAPTRSQVTPRQARDAVVAAKAASGRILAVGVFVDATAAYVDSVAGAVGLDLVQLHGSDAASVAQQINLPAYVVLRLSGDSSVENARMHMGQRGTGLRDPIAYMIDGYHPEHHGGTGIRADWSLAAALAVDFPLVLAGGLTPENVEEAIATVRPLGVDVSSGVEVEGVKDAKRIQAFVWAAKKAFAGIGGS